MGRLTRSAAAVVCMVVCSVLVPGAANAAPAPDAPKRALLIGVSAYQPPTVPTAGSANDARDMHSVLVGSGWPADGIRLLVDGDATAANIRAGMDWLTSSSAPNTFSVVHYSGHTKQSRSGFDDGDAEEYDEFLWSVDNQFISDGEFGQRMRAVQGHAWINVSNCEAAGFDDDVSAPNRLFTAASMEDQKGYERFDTKRSIFTGLLTEAFRNGAVSIQEAFAYAAEAAPRHSVHGEYGPQTPYMAGGDNTPWQLGSASPPPAGQKPAAPGPVPPVTGAPATPAAPPAAPPAGRAPTALERRFGLA